MYGLHFWISNDNYFNPKYNIFEPLKLITVSADAKTIFSDVDPTQIFQTFFGGGGGGAHQQFFTGGGFPGHGHGGRGGNPGFTFSFG